MAEQERKQVIDAGNKEMTQTSDGKINEGYTSTNSDEEAHAHADEEEVAVEVDETAGADKISLVSTDVIQLLDTILERIE
ncbi:hypothetical protein OS493_029866 [Desmophyllum pertusum]|uniref:Uncharacterized protein n=1 Tax=Desmophyllum pertusum TaxID=174260 RepID=A0A9W9YK03_9CNID|nr:hypothetical protein OS493_029866 [Desmophyllum pertusum]